ncbi:MAG: hypothetical protein EU544_04500 [Promethearchaeota archaeon]|nr:MAG: hypothetical protein EU544_04500 [Candidatus Lokiarchaeota archaeon]
MIRKSRILLIAIILFLFNTIVFSKLIFNSELKDISFDNAEIKRDSPNIQLASAPLNNYTMRDHSYTWIDATSGIRCNMDGTDDGYQLFGLPFPFIFYNFTYEYIYICTNGFASFEPSGSFSNQPLPRSNPELMIAPFWEDLMADNPCNIFVRNMSNRVVIEWNNYRTLGGTLIGTFQIILFQNGKILFNYQNIIAMTSATCGLNYGYDLKYYTVFDDLRIDAEYSVLFTPTSLSSSSGSGAATIISSELVKSSISAGIMIGITIIGLVVVNRRLRKTRLTREYEFS